MKERTQCVVSTMPFKHLYKLLIKCIVYFEVLWMNAFPVKKGVLDKIFLHAIVVRNNLNWEKTANILYRHTMKYMTTQNRPTQ